MTKSARLIRKLNTALWAHGLYIKGELHWPRGGARQEDCCRWVGAVAQIDGTGIAILSIASWNTISQCLRGFTIEFEARKSEAHIMVHAKDD